MTLSSTQPMTLAWQRDYYVDPANWEHSIKDTENNQEIYVVTKPHLDKKDLQADQLAQCRI